jgi:kynureninase
MVPCIDRILPTLVTHMQPFSTRQRLLTVTGILEFKNSTVLEYALVILESGLIM